MAISTAKVRNKMRCTDKVDVSPTALWFGDNPDALDEVKVWMEMKKAGETDWSTQRLLDELVSEYRFPFMNAQNLYKWLKRSFPDLYPHSNNRGLRT